MVVAPEADCISSQTGPFRLSNTFQEVRNLWRNISRGFTQALPTIVRSAFTSSHSCRHSLARWRQGSYECAGSAAAAGYYDSTTISLTCAERILCRPRIKSSKAATISLSWTFWRLTTYFE